MKTESIKVVPYWNVNTYDDIFKPGTWGIKVVPYWNVNLRLNTRDFGLSIIKVVPYWNVNEVVKMDMSYQEQ